MNNGLKTLINAPKALYSPQIRRWAGRVGRPGQSVPQDGHEWEGAQRPAQELLRLHCTAPRGPRRRHGTPEASDRAADTRENVEADGQGGEAVPAGQDEPQELAALHPGHPSRHLPTPAPRLREVRARPARPQRQRVLQGEYPGGARGG